MHKFNGGRGGIVCDGCGALLVDGGVLRRVHWRMGDGHYCKWQCMLQNAQRQTNTLAVLLAQEATQIRLIDEIRPDVPAEVVARLEGDLVSKRVG